jgi:hypothetical protein
MQGNHEILSRCIKENLGFKDGKPVAACIIYKCLLHWRAFESERTAIFDHVIEAINGVLKVNSFKAHLFCCSPHKISFVEVNKFGFFIYVCIPGKGSRW